MTAPTKSKLTFIPVPLATGDHLQSVDSDEPIEVASIAVMITLADGSIRAQNLTRLDSTGWWMPKDWDA